MNKVTIDQAIELFKEGKIGIFPTDTAFGIGCVVDNEHAVQKLFDIKKRPENKATPILVDSLEMVREIVCIDIDPDALSLAQKYWPGGLTIVLKSHNSAISNLVTGGTNTLGFRIPDHSMIVKIIKKVGKPILAPSANFSGEKTPFQMSDIDLELLNLVDFVITGECKTKIASTVVDCAQKPFRVIRNGAVQIDPEFL